MVHRSHDVGHGREEHRELQAVTVHDLLFPHARQVLRITRRRRALDARRWTTETVYAITDLAWAARRRARRPPQDRLGRGQRTRYPPD